LDALVPRPYGLWSSPLSPRTLAQAKRLGSPAADSDGETLLWVEGRSDSGVLVASRRDDPAPRDLTDDLSVRANVGYGGGDADAGSGWAVFASGGRLYRQRIAGGRPEPITPVLGAVASPRISPDGRWVLFVQSHEGRDCLACVPLDGSQWPLRLHQGRDFYMQPCWHPSGSSIAWIAWDHPNMPWDGTELWAARFTTEGDLPRLTHIERLAGGTETAVQQPEFSPDGATLLYFSDESGWSHLYAHNLATGKRRQLTSGAADYALPAWNQGQSLFACLDDYRVLCARNENGYQRLQIVDLQGERAPFAPAGLAQWTQIDAIAPVAGRPAALVIASAAQHPPRLLEIEVAGEEVAVRTLARATGETVPAADLAAADAVSWPSFDGETAHGLLYLPPRNRYTSPGLPPLVALIHGGPTSQTRAGYNPQAQFLATRGYAVLLVNYRGSTGYGRDYMLKLRGSWGIYDVEDARTGCLELAARGLVDPHRRAIMGGSAGGYTVLRSLVAYPGFYRAAICMYGVSNLFTLAEETHKFEERYTDTLVGPLPEAAERYRELSPIFHAECIVDPIAVFQGDDDRVVPPAQSEEIVASLRARNVPHEYHLYKGEGHGWRRADTIEDFYTAVDRFLRHHIVYS
jgi:dipeptidyl aminopeptidase/acylaminoacyl peptidase